MTKKQCVTEPTLDLACGGIKYSFTQGFEGECGGWREKSWHENPLWIQCAIIGYTCDQLNT